MILSNFYNFDLFVCLSLLNFSVFSIQKHFVANRSLPEKKLGRLGFGQIDVFQHYSLLHHNNARTSNGGSLTASKTI
jgi:hypothetical protein